MTPSPISAGHLGRVYITEWQLCGLPHDHMAVWIAPPMEKETETERLQVSAGISKRRPELLS